MYYKNIMYACEINILSGGKRGVARAEMAGMKEFKGTMGEGIEGSNAGMSPFPGFLFRCPVESMGIIRSI